MQFFSKINEEKDKENSKNFQVGCYITPKKVYIKNFFNLFHFIQKISFLTPKKGFCHPKKSFYHPIPFFLRVKRQLI